MPNTHRATKYILRRSTQNPQCTCVTNCTTYRVSRFQIKATRTLNGKPSIPRHQNHAAERTKAGGGSYPFQHADPRVQPVDLLVEVPVNRIDPQLDLVRARRRVPVTARRQIGHGIRSNSARRIESTHNENRTRGGGASTGDLPGSERPGAVHRVRHRVRGQTASGGSLARGMEPGQLPAGDGSSRGGGAPATDVTGKEGKRARRRLEEDREKKRIPSDVSLTLGPLS
jgi:hypothetical protein